MVKLHAKRWKRMTMKCSRCGYRAKDIGALGKHYRKVHPKVMARKKATGRKKHCPHCGKAV